MENFKEQIETIMAKVKADPDFATKFKAEPVKALEEVMGIDLPDDKINGIIDAVEAKINLDDLTSGKGIMGAIKGLFD